MPQDPAARPLAGALREIDISDLAGVEPRDLILRPAQVAADAQAAGRALVYARSADAASYDGIGFRMFAAAPRRGPAPLQTSAWTAIQRRLTDRQKSDTVIDEILSQQVQLRHRPLALPREGEEYRYEMGLDAITLYRRTTDPSGREAEDRWTFSLTDPPAPLLAGLVDRDEPLIATQRVQVELAATHWLPFPVLLAEGRFRRLQEVRASLVRGTRPGAFYCFLSHRWLDPAHPDPDALQARFAAWQLVAYLAEAVRVADQRGLHEARRFSPRLGAAVGPRGTDLAESLIVNVLRPALDAAALRRAAGEVLALEPMLEDFGVAKATGDAGLAELRSLLADRPTLRGLAQRIYIWYDFSCLPQPPREGDDADLFVAGLRELVAAQVIGRTAIMLDDAEDYLSRAWCTLEALTAGAAGGATDLLVGSARPSTAEGEVERHFETLVEDRPHVVWRAVLDTEVFRVQTPTACMRRLGLDVTDPKDLPFIYERLRGLAAPAAIHIDDSEIVTGVLPLPAFEDRSILVRARRTGRTITAEAAAAPTATLDWTGALSLVDAGPPADAGETLIAPLWHPAEPGAAEPGAAEEGAAATPACHVAVIGACEGEAILLAGWARSHRAELESLLSVAVTGITWVATDIAPVGHVEFGALQVQPVAADVWAVLAASTRLEHCKVTGLITESLRLAGVSHVTIAVDEATDNVTVQPPAELAEGVELADLVVAIKLADGPPQGHPGGLYQWQIPEELP